MMWSEVHRDSAPAPHPELSQARVPRRVAEVGAGHAGYCLLAPRLPHSLMFLLQLHVRPPGWSHIENSLSCLIPEEPSEMHHFSALLRFFAIQQETTCSMHHQPQILLEREANKNKSLIPASSSCLQRHWLWPFSKTLTACYLRS